MTKNARIALFVLILGMISGQSSAWFSSSETFENPRITTKASEPDLSSNTYGLHYHDSENSEALRSPCISLDSRTSNGFFPVLINIDIPLSLFSKEAIEPEESLDRLLAANLRIQNMINEYLALKKRNELLLKDLRIPYLEKKEDSIDPPAEIAGRVDEGEKLKTDIENLIRHRENHNSLNEEQVDLSDGAEISRQGGKKDANSLAEASIKPFPGQNEDRSNDNELPWILSLFLFVFSFIVNSKEELLIWTMVGSISILIMMLVVKR